jgi:hypothetical protein
MISSNAKGVTRVGVIKTTTFIVPSCVLPLLFPRDEYLAWSIGIVSGVVLQSFIPPRFSLKWNAGIVAATVVIVFFVGLFRHSLHF